MRANNASAKRLVSTPGFISGKELMDKGLTFWTLTMWDDDGAMKDFRNSEPHRKAIQKLPFWCSEASYYHWTQPETVLPDWKLASENLLREGKITKVRNPSQNQLTNKFSVIKWTKLEKVFKPSKQS